MDYIDSRCRSFHHEAYTGDVPERVNDLRKKVF